ncbi:hypothetical protein [Luteibacter sp. E-22]|uniref:hypothetical protein n=1 Tax=Luteibacter sp. E-22 TaxID=3404050 RepID=UPI003CF5493D
MRSFKSLLPPLAMGLCTLALPGSAFAGNGSDPSRLPPCHSFAGADACLLPVENSRFDSLEGWTRASGLPNIGYDEDGNPYAALYTGASIRQAVYAHFGKAPQDVAYALHFRVRSDNGDNQVRAMLSMSDATGEHLLPIGSTMATARKGEWSTVELVVNGAPFAAPAHVMLEIASEGGNHDTVQVDDVHLVESRDAGALPRR